MRELIPGFFSKIPGKAIEKTIVPDSDIINSVTTVNSFTCSAIVPSIKQIFKSI